MMKAYSHSTAHYDSKGQCRYEYGPGRLVPEIAPEPEPEVVAEPKPVAYEPLAFVTSLDGTSIVFNSFHRKGIHVPIAVNGRRIVLDHPEALAYQPRTDRRHLKRLMVRVSCMTCGHTRMVSVSDWSQGRGCKPCATRHIKRELGAPLHKRPGDVLPFAKEGRRR